MPFRSHPGVVAAMEAGEAVAVHEVTWAQGTMPLRVSGYLTTPELPLELVTSVRGIVHVRGDDGVERIVVCENADGRHPWPGGRRLAGESFADTVVREVHEETGWRVDADSLRPLGWLHLAHLGPEPAANQGPYPEFVQLVFTVTASTRDVAPDADWEDADGYELASSLQTLKDARRLMADDALCCAFIDALMEPGGAPPLPSVIS